MNESLRQRAVKLRAELTAVKARARRRVPPYVHAPSETRAMIRVLVGFDHKSREALFQQVTSLIEDGSAERVAKCLVYSLSKQMTRRILRSALTDLARMDRSLNHPCSINRAKSLFLILRSHTFEIEIEDVGRILRSLHVSTIAIKEIEDMARRSVNGISLRLGPGGWASNIIDQWISTAETDGKVGC